MNSDGEYFAGFSQGTFKWSLDQSEARVLDRLEQFTTIQRHTTHMEVVYDYI